MSSSNYNPKFVLPGRFKNDSSSKSIWAEFADLAAIHKPLNLAQGYPDYVTYEYAPLILAEVSSSNDHRLHQYTRGFGHHRLVNALSELYSQFVNRSLNPLTEILVTCGATEAVYVSIAGLVEPDDEVIIIEPFYDIYEPMVRIFAGVARFVTLKNVDVNPSDGLVLSSSWQIDPIELENAFSEKTKMIIVNNPHNPTGKVFTREELEVIANLCKKYNVVCLADEVIEWMVYKQAEHIRMNTLPEMWERTLTIGSAGKIFNVSGWRCGWLYGPEYLVKNTMIAHRNNIYAFCTPIQEATALCFEKEIPKLNTPDCYFQNLPTILQPKREAFTKMLLNAGFRTTVPDGGYFILADWTNMSSTINLSSETDPQNDYKFAKWMLKNVKFLGIPTSPFYSKEHKHLASNIRYNFFMKDETLKQAENILTNWTNNLRNGSKI